MIPQPSKASSNHLLHIFAHFCTSLLFLSLPYQQAPNCTSYSYLYQINKLPIAHLIHIFTISTISLLQILFISLPYQQSPYCKFLLFIFYQINKFSYLLFAVQHSFGPSCQYLCQSTISPTLILAYYCQRSSQPSRSWPFKNQRSTIYSIWTISGHSRWILPLRNPASFSPCCLSRSALRSITIYWAVTPNMSTT